jgi:hypothetical protein
MIHPLFRLIARHPQLVAEHAQAYAALVADQMGEVAESLKRRALLLAVAGVCFLVTLILAGVALMLWGASTDDSMRAPWALFVGPLLPLAVGVGCFIGARGVETVSPLAKVREQVNADIGMLREVGAP